MTYPQITDHRGKRSDAVPRRRQSRHAVLRYLERGFGVDIDGLRCRLAAMLPEAKSVVEQFGEGAIIRDGLCFHPGGFAAFLVRRRGACLLRRRDDGTAVLVSVTSAQASQLSNRALRLRRRRNRACQT